MGKKLIFKAIANSLVDFGYPDVTPDMISEVYEAIKTKEKELPYGIVGQFAESQIKEAIEKGLLPH